MLIQLASELIYGHCLFNVASKGGRNDQLKVAFFSVTVARLHLITPMYFWRNSTPLQQKLATLEDDLKNKDDPT